MANLWNNPGIPHTGWLMAGPAQDGGSPIHRCEMCNKPDIRYLHPVRHPEYGNLTVGSECADKMTADAEIMYQREFLEKTNNRRKHYCKNGWQEVIPNVWQRTYHSHWEVTIYKVQNYYRYQVLNNLRPWHFKTLDEAKQASFDYIVKRQNQSQPRELY